MESPRKAGRPATKDRTKKFAFRLSEEEAALLEETAQRLNISRGEAAVQGIKALAQQQPQELTEESESAQNDSRKPE